MSSRALTLRETVRSAPRWARIYLPSSTLDGLVEALWLFTLGWEAARAGAANGLVLAAGAVPAVAFVLWGGSLSDRLGAHRVALWTMAARIGVMAVWAAIVITDTAPAYLAAAAAFAMGAISGVHDPAVSAMPRLLVPASGLEATTNAQRICVRLVQTVGPTVAGVLAASVGMGAVVVTAAVLGLLPLAGFTALQRHPAPSDHQSGDHGTGWQSLMAGFHWIRGHRSVSRTVPVQGVINLTSASILMAALPTQARSFGWGAGAYGIATGAFGAGMLLGSLGAFKIRDRAPRRKVPVAVTCAAIASVLVAVTGAATSPIVAVVAAGLMGLAIGPVGSILTGWTMAATAESDPAMYGRVYAVLLLVTVAAEPLGYLCFSALSSVTSTAVTSVVFGALGLVVAGIALGARSVRMSQAG